MKKKKILLSILLSILIILLLAAVHFYKKKTQVNICNKNHFRELLEIISRYDNKVIVAQSIKDKEKKKQLYKEIFDHYVLMPSIIEEYLQEQKITEEETYQKDKKYFLKIMENNFNINRFLHFINSKNTLSEKEAEQFYLDNQITLFKKFPFLAQKEKISIRAIKEQKKPRKSSFYETNLKNNKECESVRDIATHKIFGQKEIHDQLALLEIGTIEKITDRNNNTFFVLKIAHEPNTWVDFALLKKEIINKIKSIQNEEFIKKLILEKKNTSKNCLIEIEKYLKEILGE
jgi:hypothetical protein